MEIKNMRYSHWITLALVVAVTAATVCSPGFARPALAEASEAEINAALEKLYSESGAARALGEKAKGILLFPSIVKGGFLVGGQYGEGLLLKAGKPSGKYNTIQVSYGLQAGLQKYGYALFFTTDSSLSYLDKSNGWELGVGPSIVVIDVGAGKSMSTTTLKSEIYAFFFNQKGLMGGLGLQGTKITKTD